MKSAKLLREERAAKKAEMKALLNTARAENRDLTVDEKTKYDTLKGEYDTLDGDLKRQISIEEMETAEQDALQRQRAKDKKEKGEEVEKKKLRQQFRFSRAIALAADRKPMDGVEAEVTQEGEKEMRALKMSSSGLAIPSFFRAEKRDLTVGNLPSAGTTVNTEESALIEHLRPRTKLEGLGVTIMTGMNSDFDLINQLTGSSAEWEGETDIAQETGPTYGRRKMSPKRLAAFTMFSKQLVVQSSLAVENEVRRELELGMGTALEVAAINGSGTGNIPQGILNFANALDVIIDPNGGAPQRQHLLKMVRMALDSNVLNNNPDSSFSFLTTNGVWEKLSNTKVDDGSGRFVWENDMLVGYKATTSNLVPGNLTKGTGVDLAAIIFANWSQLYIAQWGGYDLVVNPYTHAKNAQIEVVNNSFWDIKARHEEAFVRIKDADVS